MKQVDLLDKILFEPPPPSCVLNMPGLPGASSSIYDKSPYGNIGTITGATWKRLPLGLWYLDFDGTDDVVDCGSSSSLDDLAALTVIVWFNPLSDGEGGFGSIVAKSTGGSWTNGWSFYQSGTKRLNFRVDHATTDLLHRTVGGGTNGTWQQVAATWDGGGLSTGIIIYRGGAVEARSVGTDADGARITDASSLMRVGNNSVGTTTFDGGIALVRVFNAVLSAAQIANIYAQERHLFEVW